MPHHKYSDKCVPFGEDDAIQKAFHEDGFVVVTNVLTEEEVSTALEELWRSPRLLGRPGIEREDISTWQQNWPQSDGGKNFLDSSDVFQDAASWDLTSHPHVVELQKLLYEQEDIMCAGQGRWGVMRPTADHPEWKTDESWLHWDQNPWTEPGFVRLQAFVCLSDNTSTSGGFACVPGFHRSFRGWGEINPMGSVQTQSGRKLDESYGVNQPFPVPQDDPCQKQVVRVLAPAGSVVVWDSRLPHQNYPNTDREALRVVHYTMMKKKDTESVEEHSELLKKKMIVMETLGEPGQRFPHGLTPTGREVNCLSGEDGMPDSAPDGLKNAIECVLEAGRAEERGDVSLAIRHHKRALQLYPDIEEWYGAILG